MNVLIVDDIATNRKLLAAILDAEGHIVTEAVDGAEALSILEQKPIDAVISDILMPRMDGYRFCYEVRTSERLRQLPFIFYTSSYTSPSDEKLALDMGADKFLTKPAPAAVLIQALQEAATVHRQPVTPNEPGVELHLMKEYNQQLVSKLEEKNSELSVRNDELNRMHSQVQHLLEHSPAVLYQMKIDGDRLVPIVVSENIHRLLGVAVTRALQPDWWLESVHVDDKARLLTSLREAMSAGGHSIEYRIRHADDSYRWIADSNRVVNDAEGNSSELVGVWTDITERKLAEEKIESQLVELRRWRNVTLNREDRVQSLKQEVNDALLLAGKQTRYAVMDGARENKNA